MREGSGDDISSLKHSKTLSTSVEDEKYRRQLDAAKKRAAAQNVDYPTFAAIVSAAHLEPIDRKSMVVPRADTRKNAPAWSFGSSGSLMKPDVGSQAGTEAPRLSKQEVLDSLAKVKSLGLRDTGNADAPTTTEKVGPVTQDGFRKSWSSLSTAPPERRLEFLGSVRPFARIFRVEIPPGILSEILSTLRDVLLLQNQNHQVATVVEILDSISKCSRLAISLTLMRQQQREILDQLFQSLRQHRGTGVDELGSKFSV